MFKEILIQMVAGATSAELRLLLAKFKELNGEVKAKQLNDAIRNSLEDAG